MGLTRHVWLLTVVVTQAALREEKASKLEALAAEIQAKAARREAEMEEGITAAVRATTEVQKAEGRVLAAENRFAQERMEASKLQLEWALKQEKEVRRAAADATPTHSSHTTTSVVESAIGTVLTHRSRIPRPPRPPCPPHHSSGEREGGEGDRRDPIREGEPRAHPD